MDRFLIIFRCRPWWVIHRLFSTVHFQQFQIIFRCRLRWVSHLQRREWRTKRDSSPVPSPFSTRSTFLPLFLFFPQYFYSFWTLKQICFNFIFTVIFSLWFHFEHFAVFNLWEIVAAAVFSSQKVVGGKIFLWSWSSLISASVTKFMMVIIVETEVASRERFHNSKNVNGEIWFNCTPYHTFKHKGLHGPLGRWTLVHVGPK